MIHRSLITIAAIVLMAFCVSSFASAKSIPERCTAEAFRPFAAKVWDIARWERGVPAHRTVAAARRRIACAPSKSHRTAMRKDWQRLKLLYGRYRALRLIAPYPGGGTWWAVPWCVVVAESGASWTAANPSGAVGPYQLLGWGAPYPANTWKEKMANHRIAAEVWASGRGASNWVTWPC